MTTDEARETEAVRLIAEANFWGDLGNGSKYTDPDDEFGQFRITWVGDEVVQLTPTDRDTPDYLTRRFKVEVKVTDVTDGPCCDLHGVHCEPPSDLCCHDCPEGLHPFHPAGRRCVLDQDEGS
jgi:hypothetical protein